MDTNNNSKQIQVLQSYQLRELVTKANQLGITKDDYIQMFSDSMTDCYYLLYYK